MVCYTYDAGSNLLSLQDGGGTVSYAYNSLNEPTTLTEPGSPGPQTTFGYDANHHRTTTTYPGNTVQTTTYDNAQRLSAMSAVNGTTTLTNFTYSYTKPVTPTVDSMLVYRITQSDSANRNATTSQTYDALNNLKEWQVTPGTGSTLSAHDYKYNYDGNRNRTYIFPDTAANETTLSYNAANEWYQSTDHLGNVNTIYWDAAGNMLGNNGFNGLSPAQTITYNAKNQLASITDTQQNAIPMSYTGAGQGERVSAGWVASNLLTPHGSATNAYGSGLLGSTDSIGTTHYTSDPSGTLASQRVPGTSTNYYYLVDGQGSVIKMVDASGNVVATYAYCPTGNASEPSFGLAAPGNPYQYLGRYEDTATKMFYDSYGYTDTNSGIGTQLCLVPIGGLNLFCLPQLPSQALPPSPVPPTCSLTPTWIPDYATQDIIYAAVAGCTTAVDQNLAWVILEANTFPSTPSQEVDSNSSSCQACYALYLPDAPEPFIFPGAPGTQVTGVLTYRTCPVGDSSNCYEMFQSFTTTFP